MAPMPWSMIIVILAITGGLADSLLTLYAVRTFGAEVEDNPLVRRFANYSGGLACFFPFFTFCVLTVFAYSLGWDSIVLALAVISWAIVAWNILAISINRRRAQKEES